MIEQKKKYTFRKVHITVDESTYQRMRAANIWADLDQIVAEQLDLYLAKMGY